MRLLGILGVAALTGCTAINVQPLTEKPDHICIELNPAVQVTDFVPVVQAALSRHGVTSSVHDKPPANCTYTLQYTARRSWDITPYLSTADISVRNANGAVVGQAHYHLRGKGGLSPAKWQGTDAKITPVVNELLGQIHASTAY